MSPKLNPLPWLMTPSPRHFGRGAAKSLLTATPPPASLQRSWGRRMRTRAQHLHSLASAAAAAFSASTSWSSSISTVTLRRVPVKANGAS